jgi:DNA-binding NarL/FixJ family response regulator
MSGPAGESSTQRGQQPIRVMVVDDHDVVRRGLRSYFDELDDVDLVGEAGDGVAAMEQVRMLADRQQLPDVVLIDLVMRRMDGLATIRAIKQDHPSVEVLVVTSFSETQRIQSALAPGAAGYVLNFTKLHMVSRTQAALWAVREGLVQVEGE